MDDDNPLTSLLIFVVLLLGSAIFYGFGSALQNLNKAMVEKRLEEGNQESKFLLRCLESPMYFVNTIQIVCSFANFLMGAVVFHTVRLPIANIFFSQMGEETYYINLIVNAIAAFLILFFVLTFGVLVPKRIGKHYALEWAYAFAYPVSFVGFILTPCTYLITLTSNLCMRLVHIDPNQMKEDVTEEELMSMVEEGHEQGVLLENEAAMIQNIITFRDKDAKDIMTHRKHMIGIDAKLSLEEVLTYLLEQNYSRFPVYQETIDNVIGILHLKDAMIAHTDPSLAKKSLISIPSMIRQATFIPETRNINLLFQSMQAGNIHMVIVVDEYGQTKGLVAMEDILEEIVGNILDEYDLEEDGMMKQADGTYIMYGRTDLEKVEQKLFIRFDEEEYDTLNGFLTAKVNHIPVQGEKLSVEYGGYLFRVLSVKNNMVEKVLVSKQGYRSIEKNVVIKSI